MIILLYLLVTYCVTWGIDYYFPPIYADFTMFIPGLIAIIFCITTHKKLLSLFKRCTLRGLLIAFSVPVAAAFIVVILSTVLSVASYSLPQATLIYHDGSHFKAWAQFILLGLPSLLMIGSFFALGEELGWRAYLLPLLKPLLPNFYSRAIAMGIAWGIWHVPIYLNVNMPLLNIFFFLVNVCLLSIILTWLFEREGSVWPTLIAHATHNILLNNVLPTLTHSIQVNERLLFGEEGILVTIAYTLIVLYLAGKGYFFKVQYPSGQKSFAQTQ